jgi:hypothetical protein
MLGARVAVDALLGVDVELLGFGEAGSSGAGWMQSTGHTSMQLTFVTPMHGS